jgi:hypothetical protein
MSKKQRKYKFKGLKGISKVLTTYYKKRYSDKEELKKKSREIKKLLSEQKLKPTVTNILKLTRKPSRKKVIEEKPELPDSLKQISYYFELVEYPRYILSCTNEIWFTSNLWSSELEDIQGGTLVEYETYFQDYVNYINSMKTQTTVEEKRYETDWLVKCTEPQYNPLKKRWESKIISVDDDGDIIDYGFDPKNPKEKALNVVLSTVEPTPIQKTKAEPTKKEPEPTKSKSIEEIKAQAELVKEKKELEREQKEKLKQENIKSLMDLFKSGAISKLEFKEMMNDIKKG